MIELALKISNESARQCFKKIGRKYFKKETFQYKGNLDLERIMKPFD